MSDIIHLLPDSVANQIAAGEVIQRPASVVKELVENAIDSGASVVKIIIKDAGKTLVQVVDNGCGMSETDARLSFERHATSKIKSANDLFAIRTMGFRGEALASIAAIAYVELKTKRVEDELGTFINISGSELVKQEPLSCPNGTNFLIKNLFFNVPARRKFLKSNTTEFRHIVNEVQRIALPNPEISFVLIHNDVEVYNLPASNLHQRIVSVFGKNAQKNLIKINTSTSIINIKGFIGKPEYAKKKSGEQFFFVNNRYMRHPYFYRAVLKAYERILPHDSIPSFFIYFDIDPKSIDINIHPTKTEIKFDDERGIWQILQVSIKESLGKYNIVPSIDFSIDADSMIDIPSFSKNSEVKIPSVTLDPNYNPFKENNKGSNYYQKKDIPDNWEQLYSGFENEGKQTSNKLFGGEDDDLSDNTQTTNLQFYQLKNKYILTSVKSGLMMIDQKRAHERILYEKFLRVLKSNVGVEQKNLFPESFNLNAADAEILKEIINDVNLLGFDISEFSDNTFVINGTPADLAKVNSLSFIESLIENYKNNKIDIKNDIRENVVRSIAKASAINYGKTLTVKEMSNLIDRLFACKTPNYSPSGKSVFNIISIEELDKRFKN
ncbi:MAG: DNA mismatch repair endonuclease MutL [Bacteroidales bacterium]|nr:DNA mismatch repair endonuclease MutL [Bacteroidales bacterium]